LIITPTDLSALALDEALPPSSLPPHAAAVSDSATPTVSAIALRVLLIALLLLLLRSDFGAL
jgi:hypothetical protein